MPSAAVAEEWPAKGYLVPTGKAVFGLQPMPTPEEHERMEKLRADLGDELKGFSGGDFRWSNDVNLLRYVRGYADCKEGGYEGAKAALKATIKWRRENKVDEVRLRVIQDRLDLRSRLAGVLPFRIFDTEEGPVYVEFVGGSSPSQLSARVTPEDFVPAFIELLEYMTVLCDRASRRMGRVVAVGMVKDLHNCGMSHAFPSFTKSYAQSVTSLASAHYPELLGRCIILNAPYAFTGVWKIAKHWVHPRTQAKTQITSGHTPSDFVPAYMKQEEWTALQKQLYAKKSTIGGHTIPPELSSVPMTDPVPPAADAPRSGSPSVGHTSDDEKAGDAPVSPERRVRPPGGSDEAAYGVRRTSSPRPASPSHQ
eukprot:Hpha_TRINITY_DN16903_c3_g5::TRINITY_DN16903_c3_g5_i1::g.53541::m.53541